MSRATANVVRACTLLRHLVELGLRELVVCPGSRNTPLLLASAMLVAEGAPLRVTEIVDERVAGFVALGLARATGRAAAVSCTSGSALGNLMPAVMEAAAVGAPMLLLTADRDGARRHCGAPQTTDQVGLFGRHVRASFELDAPAAGEDTDWLATTAAGVWRAAHGRWPGPVHVNLPFAKPLWQPGAALPALRRPAPRLLTGTARLDEVQLAGLMRDLRRVERGAIVVGPLEPARHGGLVGVQALADAIIDLADALGWPVLAEPASQLRSRDGVVTSLDALARVDAWVESAVPQCILRIGATPTSRPTWRWLQACAERGTETVLLASAGAVLEDATHAATTVVEADTTWLCRALAGAPHIGYAPVPAFMGGRELERTARRTLDRAARDGLWEGSVVAELVDALPENALLHVANSMAVRALDSFAGRLPDGVTVLCNRGLNGIDGTVGSAVGAALGASRDADAPVRTVVLLGDLAALHDLGALAPPLSPPPLSASRTSPPVWGGGWMAAAQTPPPPQTGGDVAAGDRGGADRGGVSIVVVDNGGGGIFEFLPVAGQIPRADFERLFAMARPVDVAAVASALGIESVARVESREALGPALRRSLQAPGVSLVTVHISRADSVARHQAAWQAVTEQIGVVLAASRVHEASHPPQSETTRSTP